MAGPVAIQVQGLKELRKACKQVGVGMDQLKEAHQKAAVIVLSAAWRRMPRVSGALKSSYRASALQTGGKISSRLAYAGVSEFGGTIPRYHSRKRTHHKPTASSRGLDSYYVYPAAKEKESEIIAVYDGAIDQILREHFRSK